MKRKSKTFHAYFLILVTGLFFAAIGLIINLPPIIANEKMQRILETGIDGTGYNVEMHDGGLEINDVPYFYLTFDYVDAEGVERSGKTSTTYTQAEASQAVMRRKIDIIYNDKGAVEKSFDKVAANKPHKITLLIFTGVGALAAVFGVYGFFRKGVRTPSVAANGVNGYGTVAASETDVDKNGAPRFRLKISFLNQRGESVTGETEWTGDYAEVSGLNPGDGVKIKYYGKKVRIEKE
ncbi:MAG: hypothetical protein J6Z34_00125 [Clostridia bacterium]|nr:hypothetical protein [Clostridia bacterium]